MKTIKTKEEISEQDLVDACMKGLKWISRLRKHRKDLLKEAKEVLNLEPKTFNCGLKALAWLRENEGREIEYKIRNKIFLLRVDKDEYLQKKHIKNICSEVKTERVFNKWIYIGDLNFRNIILNWKEIKVLPKEKL